MKKTALSVTDRLLKNDNLSHIPAVKWGTISKDTAKQAYIEEITLSHHVPKLIWHYPHI